MSAGPELEEIEDAPSADVQAAAVAGFLGGLRTIGREQMAAIEAARPALARLVKACADHRMSGQILKVRELLYSAWNGQSTSLSEILGLDWSLKQDLMAVLLAFGCEPRGASFFYDAISDAFRGVKMFDWFVAAHRADDEGED